MITAYILHCRAALAIRHVSRGHKRSRAGLDRSLIDIVDVFDVEMDRARQWCAFPLRALATTTDHQHRPADVVFGVKAALRSQAMDDAGHAKGLPETFGLCVHVTYNQVRSDGTKALTNSTDVNCSLLRSGTHGGLLLEFCS